MVYLIWIVHQNFYNIGKSLKIQNLFFIILIFLSKDHQLAYFNMLVPVVTLAIW